MKVSDVVHYRQQQQQTLTGLDLRNPRKVALQKLGGWVPLMQWLVMRDSREFDQIIDDMVKRIEAMPTTMATEGQGEAVVRLHYFSAAGDWYITERDLVGDGTEQCFGWVVLNGDLEMAELGYISVEELVRYGVELDLHWRDRPLAEVMHERKTRRASY